MQANFLRIQPSKAAIAPGDELLLLTPRQIRALAGPLHDDRTPESRLGTSELLATLGPCPAPAALRGGVNTEANGQFWVAIELCHWRIEPGGLRWMAHGQSLAISESELAQLFVELEDLFAGHPASLQRGRNGELSLRCEAPLAKPEALDPDQLLGAEMKPHLPNLTIWQRWLNEAQMQLATSAVNSQRIQAGQLAINSLWFWGAEAPKATGKTLALVYKGGDPILQARAHLGHGSPVQIRDYRDVDLEALRSELKSMPRAVRLLSSEGVLYQCKAPNLWYQLARWMGVRS